jgi:outer membrane receptor protein involved in Fe transport
VPETDGGPNGNGYHHENNSNDYYFASWQMSALDGRLKTNIGVNQTHMKLLTWNGGASQTLDNAYTASKVSPMYGVVFDVTKEVSVFALRSTSLFPDSTKDSFGHQFGPQVGKSWEGGVKLELMDGKVSGTVSYFDIEQTGGTQSSPNHENLDTATWDRLTPAERLQKYPGKTREQLFAAGDIIAGGKQESKGVDLDLVYQPTRELQFVLSYEHVKHQFVTSADPSTIGQTYPGAQKDRYALLSKYTFRSGGLKDLSLGLGLAGGSKSLVDYQTRNGVAIARYEPARMVAEAFAAYRVKLLNQNTIWQLNIQNITKTSDYAGWKSTGSGSVLATERYKVPTPVRFQLTFGLDF